MADLNAKLARQIAARKLTADTIAKLEKLVHASKDEAYRINGNLVLSQLATKLDRQDRAVKVTEWMIKTLQPDLQR